MRRQVFFAAYVFALVTLMAHACDQRPMAVAAFMVSTFAMGWWVALLGRPEA